MKKTYSLIADLMMKNGEAPKILRMPISLVRATIIKSVMPIIPKAAKMTAMMLLDMMSNDNNPIVNIQYSSTDGEKRIVDLKRSTEKIKNPVEYYVTKTKNGKTIGYMKLSEFSAYQ